MNRHFRILVLLLAAFFLFSGFSAVFAASNPAYNFELKSLDNSNVSLASYKGRTNVLLLFWTTWCPYCRNQLSEVEKKLPEFKNKNIEILAVDAGEQESKVRNFVTSKNLSMKVLLDTSGRVANQYKVSGVPTYVLVNKEGDIVSVSNSFPEKKIKELLD